MKTSFKINGLIYLAISITKMIFHRWNFTRRIDVIWEKHQQNRSSFSENIKNASCNNVGNSFTSQDIAIVTVFGAFWGLMEINLSVTLKGLRIPLRGALLTAAAAITLSATEGLS
jgi:hypothetical protein